MSEQFKREPLKSEEANSLAQACQTPLEKLIIWTLLDTGLRVHEFCALTPQNIDWQRHQLIVHGKGRNGRKKRRIVPYERAPRTQKILESWFATEKEVGVGIRSVQFIVANVARRAGIQRKCTPHVLRHTFAVGCLEKGISFPSLKQILGHDHLSTTFIYSNMQPETAIEEFKRKF